MEKVASVLSVVLFVYIRATAEAEGDVMAMKNRFKPASNILQIVPWRYTSVVVLSFYVLVF